jgi:hypothetical protein
VNTKAAELQKKNFCICSCCMFNYCICKLIKGSVLSSNVVQIMSRGHWLNRYFQELVTKYSGNMNTRTPQHNIWKTNLSLFGIQIVLFSNDLLYHLKARLISLSWTIYEKGNINLLVLVLNQFLSRKRSSQEGIWKTSLNIGIQIVCFLDLRYQPFWTFWIPD